METEQPLQWVAAPPATAQNVPSVNGVYLKPGERVEWIWAHTSDGSYVTGAEITPAADGQN